MSYATATPQQQAQVQDLVLLQRAACVQIWQLNKTINAIVAAWNANVLGILGSPQGTPIPDPTGYAGAVTLTDTQVTNLLGILESFQSNTMTAGNQTVFTLATGPNNML
jgi:hypothetical protein